MKPLKFVVLWMMFSVSLVECAYAEEKAVSLVTGDNYFPFVSSTLPDGGWSTALVKSVFLEMGYKTDIEVMPWARGAKWTRENKYLGTFPYVFTQARAKQYYYSEPISYVPVRVFTLKNNNIKSINDLQKKRLCIPLGYSIGESISQILKTYNMTVNRAKDTAGCFGQVAKQWSDAGLVNGYFTSAHITDVFEQDDNFVIFKQHFDTVPLYFIISNTHPHAKEWIEKFNLAHQSLLKTGKVEVINTVFRSLLEDSLTAAKSGAGERQEKH